MLSQDKAIINLLSQEQNIISSYYLKQKAEHGPNTASQYRGNTVPKRFGARFGSWHLEPESANVVPQLIELLANGTTLRGKVTFFNPWGFDSRDYSNKVFFNRIWHLAP